MRASVKGRLAAAMVALAATASLPAPSQAAPTACPAHFLSGQAPDLLRDALATKARELCFTGYATLHSGLTRTSLWAAERLTAERVSEARGQERVNRFHAEDRLPAEERAELSDYERSGFDRGHLAPSGDMPDGRSQAESFTLANMIPQDGDLNRGLWAGLEAAVRALATRHGEVYVVTGPIYEGNQIRSLRGRVFIPTSIYKAVYVPSTRSGGAYVAENTSGKGYRVVSLAELAALTGMEIFPALPQDVKARPAQLPEPTRIRSSEQRTPPADGWKSWIPDARHIGQWIWRMLR